MAVYDIVNQATPLVFKTGDIINCPYSGAAQKIILPAGRYKLECWGAQGGSHNTAFAQGGKGGYSKGTITLKKPTPVYMYSGGAGTDYTFTSYTSQGGGGFNGGGNAGYGGGGGGGGSDIRIGYDSLDSRVIVAGGGGGANAQSSTQKANGGAGGGPDGSDGGYYGASSENYQGKGASLFGGGEAGTAPVPSQYDGFTGDFGLGGSTKNKYNSNSILSNGAGGGGWYGGGAADNNSSNAAHPAGGGGGSGYVWTSDYALYYINDNLLKNSYYLEDTQILSGNAHFASPDGTDETGHPGDGYTRVTILELFPMKYIKTSSQGKIQQSSYIELEYIESDGTQYIDTGFVPNQNTKIEIITIPNSTEEITGNKIGFIPYGAKSGTSKALELYSSNLAYYFNYGSVSSGPLGTASTGRKLHIIQNKNEIELQIDEDTPIRATLSQNTFTTTSVNLILFGTDRGDEGRILGSQKIYECKIYNNGTLIRNYIPAMRISDGKMGLWDAKNLKFYMDAAGGNFAGNTLSITNKNTLFLLKGTSGIRDTTGHNKNIVKQNVVVSSTQYKFAGKSIEFKGSSYLSLGSSPITSAGDFTIDWWEYYKSGNGPIYNNDDENGEYGLRVGLHDPYGSIETVYKSQTSTDSFTLTMGTYQPNMWIHYALVRKRNTIYSFQNGTLKDQTKLTNPNFTIQSMHTMGMGLSVYYVGFIDNFRISNIARWTSNFEPPIFEYGNNWHLINDIYLKQNANTWLKEVR